MPTFLATATSTYSGKPPITSIRAELLGGHYHVGIWINHAKAGELCLLEKELMPFLQLVANPIPIEEESSNGAR